MKVLITGGAGFIGSHFVRLLVREGFKVSTIDKLTYAGDLKRLEDVFDKISFYKADITNEEFVDFIFEKEKPESIIHFAAETHVDRSIIDPSCFIKTNVEGTFKLLEVSKKHNIKKFINIITDEVYGEIKDGKFKESSPRMPNSPYSVSKASQDMLGRAYFRTYGLPVVTIRPSNNYGPWQYPEKLIPVIIIKAINNEPIPIYKDGSNIREWLYVEDCVEAIYKLMEKAKEGEIYNIGTNIEKTNLEVANTILSILNKPKELIHFVEDRKGHDYRYAVDIQKIKELNWSPKTSFEEGIQKTIDWYISNQNWVYEKIETLREYWKKVYR